MENSPYYESLINDICEYFDSGDCCHPDYQPKKMAKNFCLKKCNKRKLPLQGMALKLLAELSIVSENAGFMIEEKLGNESEYTEEFKILDAMVAKIKQVDEFLSVLKLKKEEKE